jgi:hypothetical protein
MNAYIFFLYSKTGYFERTEIKEAAFMLEELKVRMKTLSAQTPIR